MDHISMTLNTYFEWISAVFSDVYFTLPVLVILSPIFVHLFSRPKLNLPKGPTGLPIVGYLPFLGKEPHKTLDKLKEKYGNIFRVRLGMRNVIILADYEAVKEGMNQSATINRPPGIFDFLPDGFGFSGTNGEEWAEQRRFAMKTMKNLGLGRTRWVSLVHEEVDEFLRKISDSKGQPIDTFKSLAPSIANNILSVIFGKRFPLVRADDLILKMELITEFFAVSSLWNFLPWLCIFLRKLKFTSYYETFRSMVSFNGFFRDQIQHQKKTKSENENISFVTEYLQVLEDNERQNKETFLNEKLLTGDAQGIFVGGTDTTTTSLNWLFLVVCEFPETQDKIYAELESVLGKEQTPSWEDRAKFPYTSAVIMEMLRWKTVAPLTAPRFATHKTKIFDYDIPKGMLLVSNIWGLHHDSRYWEHPEKFMPERFLKNDGKEVNWAPESYAPFSVGRRKCPGELVAMTEIFIYFTAVMQRFQIRVPNGGKPILEGILGLLNVPYPQKLCFIPRE